MDILRFVFNPFGVNTYLVYDHNTRDCAIVDPGMSDAREWGRLRSVIEDYGLKPVHMINTHMHADHILGNHFLRDSYGLRTEANRRDAFLGESLGQQKRLFGLDDDGTGETIDVYLSQGDRIRIGRGELEVIEVPGHSPGGIALYDREGKYVITGDSLFQGSIGRTDLPGGDMPTLIDAVRAGLLTLPADTVVYPGHGPATTVRAEAASNPYLI